MRAGESQIFHSLLYFGAAHEQIPEQSATVILDHNDFGALIDRETIAIEPDRAEIEGIGEDIAAVGVIVPLSLVGEWALYPLGSSLAVSPQQLELYPKKCPGLFTQ